MPRGFEVTIRNSMAANARFAQEYSPILKCWCGIAGSTLHAFNNGNYSGWRSEVINGKTYFATTVTVTEEDQDAVQ